MADVSRDPAIRGKTIQFTWTDGPTKGTTHEHLFHVDGTVQWRDAERAEPAQAATSPERPAYAAVKVAEQTYVISYLAGSGYTLTVVLNFANQQIVGFASAAKEWYPLRGTFKVVK